MLLRNLLAFVLTAVAQPLLAADIVLPMVIETSRGTIEVVSAPVDVAAVPRLDCLPNCLLPAKLADVATLTEVEVLAFLSTDLARGDGILIDPRLPEAHATGALPGAVNLPLPALSADNPYLGDVLLALGAVAGTGGSYDFAGAKILLVHGNGPWEDEGAAAIRTLLDIGYPVDKLRFFRGGLRDWMMSGLALTLPAVQG